MPAAEGNNELSLVEIHKGLVKRSIDQLGFIKDVNSLVVLSGWDFVILINFL